MPIILPRIIAALLLVAPFAGGSRAAELPWQFEHDKALAEAKEQHRPVLLDFSASWCGPCRMMETTTFANANVQRLMEGYTLVKIDIDQRPVLASRYKVQAIPTCIVLNEFGETVDRRTGYADAVVFSRWLADSEDRRLAGTRQSQGDLAAEQIKKLALALDAPDPAARDRALAALLDRYCAPRIIGTPEDEPEVSPDAAPAVDEPGVKLVEDELRRFTKSHPAVAAAHLNEPRLAVRILFARLLAEQPGSGLAFDPWASSAERQTAAAEYLKRLPPN